MTTEPEAVVGSPGAGRSSSLSARTAAAGSVTWSSDLGDAGGTGDSPSLLSWGDRIVVAGFAAVGVFDRDGRKLWSRAKQGGTPVAVQGERLLIKGRHRFLDALDAEGRTVLDQAPFPGAMGAETQVQLFWPRGDDFLAVLFRPAPQELAEGDSPDKPPRPAKTTLLKNRYSSSLGDWIELVEGDSAPAPLLLPSRNRVTLHVGQALRYDVAEERLVGRFELPLAEPVDWSVDADETYVVNGYDDARKTVVALDGEGRLLWRWIGDQDDAWAPQPPIRLPGGRVAVLTGQRVIVLDQGRPAWQFDARGESLRHGARIEAGAFEVKDGVLLGKGDLRRGTALGDGSLLVTNGPVLVHLAADGRRIFSVSMDADILSAPLVDADGHVYVATATRLVRID